ncbi:MAG: serine/threonine-protein kinase [Kofleriaceae bacterium]
MPSHEGDWEQYPKKFGKYHLLAPLAQGGMGALYLAVTGDRGLERLMVIKTVLPHLADAEYVARFRDEAKVVVKLSHGNLIPVFDAGLVGGELFLAMDFVEGRDLRAVWNRCAKKQVAFPIDVAVYICKELCRGLAYAHSFPDLNLVHRDVSPPNVLVSYTGEVKLTDFGLASSTLKLEKTAPGIIYGKVAYMSPEQARGEKLDGRSDMYAAGIVLWELLTGRQLFPPGKDQPQDLLSRAKNPEPPRPSKRAPRVPVELDEICLKALAAEKADRYKDCDEMRQALQGWLAVNAPTTDGTRMSTFLQELFAEDIVRERAERAEMISRVRTRALTMPPTDELRLMIEQSDKVSLDEIDKLASSESPVRKPGSQGRRASDRGVEGEDRRRAADGDRRGDRRPQSRPSADGSAAIAMQEQSEPNAELDVGSEIDGRYRIVELIGEGGMGKVYLAEHVEIGKRVALKVLHPSYSRMPDLVERFRREARAASKIGHPNIVDVTDSGATTDGSVYFVMEYLEGVELGSVIEREGALDVARALRITGQICRALSAAHREGIIHRDLKPENIFLITRGGEADVVKVLDFGIAKTTEAEAARERRLTSPGMAMGTPEYMAPEQAAGRAADARTDIYSLGAIMYEMTTGLPPYTGDNFMEILTKKATVDPPVPITVRTDLPLQVSQLVAAAMSRNPDERPQSMDALEYELNKCLAGRGVAVAQILGMTTDANVVASLNSGLSMRNLDDGIVRPAQNQGRAGTSGISEVWETRSGVSRQMPPQPSQPVRASSEPVSSPGYKIGSDRNARPGTPSPVRAASQDDRSPAAVVVAPATPAPSLAVLQHEPNNTSSLLLQKKSSALGPILLLVVLLGGGGALAYMMLNNADKHTPADQGPGSAAPVVENVQTPAVTPDAQAKVPDKAIVETPNPNTETPKVVDQGSNSGAKTTNTQKAHPPVNGGQVKKNVAIADDVKAEPKAVVLKEIQEAEAKADWANARVGYQKLFKVKGMQQQALYGEALAAFQMNDSTAAEQVSTKAAAINGPWKLKALLLHADAIYKQGDAKRAKDNYISLRALAGDKDFKATVTKKIALCNSKLGLAERDGVIN